MHRGALSSIPSDPVRPDNLNQFTIPDDPLASRFRFILVAAARAKQLHKGHTPKLQSSHRREVVAMEETRRGLVPWSS